MASMGDRKAAQPVVQMPGAGEQIRLGEAGVV
jgi:hypothetical protein